VFLSIFFGSVPPPAEDGGKCPHLFLPPLPSFFFSAGVFSGAQETALPCPWALSSSLLPCCVSPPTSPLSYFLPSSFPPWAACLSSSPFFPLAQPEEKVTICFLFFSSIPPTVRIENQHCCPFPQPRSFFAYVTDPPLLSPLLPPLSTPFLPKFWRFKSKGLFSFLVFFFSRSEYELLFRDKIVENGRSFPSPPPPPLPLLLSAPWHSHLFLRDKKKG